MTLRGDWPHRKTVFVLGAGFTRAFFSRAPLLRDWHLGPRIDLLRGLPTIKTVLELWERSPDRNVEQLMSRVEDAMPYDSRGDQIAFQLLTAYLRRDILDQIEAARDGPKSLLTMYRFASHCLFNGIDCVTFNSDTFLDEALWWANPTVAVEDEPTWHPDGGYGFFCRPATSVISTEGVFMDVTAMQLLKLHGSANWFPRLGSSRPYGPEALVHFEEWLPVGDEGGPASIGEPYRDELLRKEIQRALEADPLFIPPVLGKSASLQHPVISMVWGRALEILQRADEVVFVGYSFPTTDLASRQLFAEGLAHVERKRILVVGNQDADEARRQRLTSAYRDVLGDLPDSTFQFCGAVAWARGLARAARPIRSDGQRDLAALHRYQALKWWRRKTLRQLRRGAKGNAALAN